MIETLYEMQGHEHEFLASLQGIDLQKEQHKAKMKQLQREADAERAGLKSGKSWQEADLSDLGIEIEVEGE